LKSDEWIAWSNKLREILEEKIEILFKAKQQSAILKEYRERVIEKEINVACGNWDFFISFKLSPNINFFQSFRVPRGENACGVQELEEQASAGGRRAYPRLAQGETFKRQSHDSRVSLKTRD
jgi:hypothetical protein